MSMYARSLPHLAHPACAEIYQAVKDGRAAPFPVIDHWFGPVVWELRGGKSLATVIIDSRNATLHPVPDYVRSDIAKAWKQRIAADEWEFGKEWVLAHYANSGWITEEDVK